VPLTAYHDPRQEELMLARRFHLVVLGILTFASTLVLGAWAQKPGPTKPLTEVRSAEGPMVSIDSLTKEEDLLVRAGRSQMLTFTYGQAEPAGCELFAGTTGIHCWGFGYNCIVYATSSGVHGACIKCSPGYCW
jgi:hypothetical protein